MRHSIAIVSIILMVVIIGCGKDETPVTTGPDRIAFTITSDFETGELDAWESYPYAQDIGYDPRLLCQREPAHNGSKYAIARIVMPNDAVDLSQGFTRQIDLWTTNDTHMRFALFLMTDRKPDWVDVSLGLFDGRLFTKRIAAPDVNRWLEIDIPADEFLSKGAPLGAGEHLQVIALKAFYPLVTHLASYTILMDDFTINGERTRQFIAREPSSTWFDKFGISILNRHYFYGDTVGIGAAPEGDKKLTRAECDLIGPDGRPVASGIELYDDGSHGDESAGDNIWSNDSMRTIGESDPRGQWEMKLTGRAATGADVEWRIRFLVPGKRLTSDIHPRLFFTTEELAERLANDPPAAKKILDNAVNSRDRYENVNIDDINEGKNLAKESLTGGPYSQASSSGQWRRPLATLGGIIEEGAWKYAISGDEEAGLRAKKALLKLSNFSSWHNPWMEYHGRHMYFPLAYTIRQAAIGYDFLYPLMNDEERSVVRQALTDKGIKQFYRDMVVMNRMPSSLSNHIAVIVAGVGAAATAVYGDDPENPYLEPYLSGIMTKMKDFIDTTYFPEGSYGEPYTYQAMASRDLTETLFAFERNFGVDYTTTTDLKDLWIYPLYVTHSSGRYQDFGDVSLYYGMTQTHMMWLTYRMRNPWTYAYVGPYLQSGRGGWFGWLWYTDGIEPRYRSELPTSKLFKYKGNMVMRSDWEDDGTIMIFKCGPNSNHYHLDQGTFVIMTNGDELLSDAGHSSSYYANLYYPGYYTQPIGHNVMLVDMNPESQNIADYENGVAALRDYPQIVRSFASDVADDVEGDLTCVYKGAVTKYTRSLLYMKPGPVYLFDNVEGNGGHEYNWLFHAEHTGGKNSITYENGRMTITRPKARLTMDVVAPDIASSSIRDSDRDEGFLALSSDPGLTETVFLAALMPESAGKAPAAMKTEKAGGNGWTGCRVERGSTVDYAFFRQDGKIQTGTVEEFDAAAEQFAVRLDRSGRIEKFIVHGTKLTKQGATPFSFSSTAPVTAAAAYGDRETLLDVDAPAATDVTMTLLRSPSYVMRDDAPFENWTYDNASKTITVKAPEGSVRLVIGR